MLNIPTVGLTGNIACGKSFIAKLFRVYGVPIIDSDIIAREVVAKGSPTLEAIKEEFGNKALTSTGELNRSYLRELVFSDQKKLIRLNAIMFPAIRRRTLELSMLVAYGFGLPDEYLELVKSQQEQQAAHSQEHNEIDEAASEEARIAFSEPLDKDAVFKEGEKPAYIMLDIPLLFENKLEHTVDRILVVDASPEVQLQRIIQRDKCSKENALNIIANQIDREYKIAHADDLIQTDRLNIAEKRAHVLKLHLNYVALAKHSRA